MTRRALVNPGLSLEGVMVSEMPAWKVMTYLGRKRNKRRVNKGNDALERIRIRDIQNCGWVKDR